MSGLLQGRCILLQNREWTLTAEELPKLTSVLRKWHSCSWGWGGDASAATWYPGEGYCVPDTASSFRITLGTTMITPILQKSKAKSACPMWILAPDIKAPCSSPLNEPLPLLTHSSISLINMQLDGAKSILLFKICIPHTYISTSLQMCLLPPLGFPVLKTFILSFFSI